MFRSHLSIDRHWCSGTADRPGCTLGLTGCCTNPLFKKKTIYDTDTKFSRSKFSYLVLGIVEIEAGATQPENLEEHSVDGVCTWVLNEEVEVREGEEGIRCRKS
jgi:hypothetical protein